MDSVNFWNTARHAIWCLVPCLCLMAADLPTPLPTTGRYDFNPRYATRRVAGRYGWMNGLEYNGGLTMMLQNGELEELAIFGIDPDPVAAPRGELKPEEVPLLKHRMELFRAGRLPMVGGLFDRGFNNRPFPTEAELKRLAGYPNFLGFRAFNEWGTNVDRFLQIRFHPNEIREAATKRRVPIFKDFFPPGMKEPMTREEFTEVSHFAWNKMNAPFHGQVYALDASHCWSISWPGGWGPLRSIITEMRTPYRNNQIFHALTRGAARMWGVPYGFLLAYDWRARIGHPVATHLQQKPSDSWRRQQGVPKITPSLYRRLWYYAALSNAAVLLDELDQQRYADWADARQYRLSWYGELCREVHEFQRMNPDLGVNYNPVGLLLSWHNGWGYKGDKAFYRYPYNAGEHQTREFINRLLFRFSEELQPHDEFSPTPFGDLFDILRLDTPKGPLPMELLQNYRVLFLLGEHPLDAEAVARLQEYVRSGGCLVVNSEQIRGKLPDDFLGATLAREPFRATSMTAPDGKELPSKPFLATELLLRGAQPLYHSVGKCVGAVHDIGKGRVITIGAHWLLEERQEEGPIGLRRFLLPVASDLLTRMLPALTPFTFEGDRLPEQLAWQVNQKPNGWLLALFNNGGLTPAIRLRRGYAGPDVIDPCKALDIRICVPKQLGFAVELISGRECVFSRDATRRFLECHLEPGELAVFEFSSRPIPERQVVRPVNLALKCPAKATSEHAKYPASKAVDGDTAFHSAWWSEGSTPQSITVDLKKVEEIRAIRVVPAWSEDNRLFPRITQFTVEASEDGDQWHPVVDESRNIMPDTKHGVLRGFTPRKARFVRVNVLFNSCRQGGQIVELEVFGPRTRRTSIPWHLDRKATSFPPEILKLRNWKPLTLLEPVQQKQDERPVTRNRECLTGGKMSIRGRIIGSGLGCHARSEIVYRLNPDDGWQAFSARVGIDDCAGGTDGSVVFRIYTDGRLAADSGLVTPTDPLILIWADLRGVTELRLVVDDCGDGIRGDVANWGDPLLRK